MFETGFNVWLQSMGSEAMTALLSGVTLFGYMPSYAVLIVSLAFGFRLRPGLAVLGAVLLTGIVTEAAKNVVAFPRPDQVDDRLMRTPASGGDAIVARGGAPAFWALPDRTAIEKVRALERGNYGFPSSHVSATTAFFLTASWVLRSSGLLAFTVAWVPLMALSRLYLGRHFLADVLCGLIIGLAVSAIWIRHLPAHAVPGPGDSERHWLRGLWLFSMALLMATVFWRPLDPRYVGALIGLTISYSVIAFTGAPPDGGTTRQRLSRVLLALILFACALKGSEWVLAVTGQSGGRLSTFFLGVVVTTATFGGTIVLSRRLGLSEPPH